MGLRVVFFGTPKFASHILEELIKKKINIVAVVTKPDKPQGRDQKMAPSAVKTVALAHNLPLHQPLKASSPEFAAVLKELNADLFIVVAYSEIFKENLLQMPRLGCVNVHASILPKYRGAAPIHRSVMNGDKESGVTIMMMAKDLDAGEILKIEKTPIYDDMTTSELSIVLSDLGAHALIAVLEAFERGTVTKTAQDPSLVTYAAKVSPAEAEIDWSWPAEKIHNHIRGLNYKPGAWTYIKVRGEQKRLLIKKSKVESFSGEAGQILQDQKGLVVAAGKGSISILELQLEGKKSLPIEDFLRGIPKKDLEFVLKK